MLPYQFVGRLACQFMNLSNQSHEMGHSYVICVWYIHRHALPALYYVEFKSTRLRSVWLCVYSLCGRVDKPIVSENIYFYHFHSSNFHCEMADRQIDSLLHFTHAIYMWDVNIEYERMADLRRMPRCRESRMCVISLCFFFFIYSLHCAANIENERRRPAATAAAITTYSNERDNFFILSQFEFSLSLWLYG